MSILYRKSIELTIKSTLLSIADRAYKNISHLKSHLLVLLFVKLLPAIQLTNASKWNTFNSTVYVNSWKKFQLDSSPVSARFTWGHDERFSKFLLTKINKCCKEEKEEKYEEFQMTFETAYLGNRWADSFDT